MARATSPAVTRWMFTELDKMVDSRRRSATSSKVFRLGEPVTFENLPGVAPSLRTGVVWTLAPANQTAWVIPDDAPGTTVLVRYDRRQTGPGVILTQIPR